MKCISIICAIVVLLSACGDSESVKLDRDFAYQSVQRRDAPGNGVRLGSIQVPGHTQEVTLFLYGVPPDSEEVEGMDDEPPDVRYIYGEINREPNLKLLEKDFTLKQYLPELSWIALVAYYHGGRLVILTKDKVYFARTDTEDEIDSRLEEER